MSATLLTLLMALWGFLAATVAGIAVHTHGQRRRRRTFTRHADQAIAVTRGGAR